MILNQSFIPALIRFNRKGLFKENKDECGLVHVVIYEKVKDHAKWLKGFNGDAPNRKGSKGGMIVQFDEDPNKHYIIFEWSEKEARDFLKFSKTPDMQKVFKEAGVVEQTIQLCSSGIKFDK
jgi:hypothetical protein